MKKQKVLFVCIHNGARSQMAEAWLNYFYGDRFEAKSAGLEPGSLNPLVVMAMEEAGIDISGNRTKSVFDMIRSGDFFLGLLPSVTNRLPSAVPFFPDPLNAFTGVFPIRLF